LTIPTVSDPADLNITADDVVLLAVKSQDTEGAFTTLVGNTPIAHIYVVMVIVPATYLSPRTVSVGVSPTLGICDDGAYPRRTDEITKDLAEALVASRWSAEAVSDIMRFKYGKLLENLSNALEIALGLDQRGSDVGTIVRNEGVGALKRRESTTRQVQSCTNGAPAP
jgi:2-dehydropantoate 2-reductase